MSDITLRDQVADAVEIGAVWTMRIDELAAP
jgi:hypothetical protein